MLFALLLLGSSRALQFLTATSHTGDTLSPNSSIALDFTVYSPIVITQIGLVDADAAGIVGHS